MAAGLTTWAKMEAQGTCMPAADGDTTQAQIAELAGRCIQCGKPTQNAGGECTRCLNKRNGGGRAAVPKETLHIPPAEIPAHEARIAAHAERVAVDLAELEQRRWKCA